MELIGLMFVLHEFISFSLSAFGPLKVCSWGKIIFSSKSEKHIWRYKFQYENDDEHDKRKRRDHNVFCDTNIDACAALRNYTSY